jgi:hypothetical protein
MTFKLKVIFVCDILCPTTSSGRVGTITSSRLAQHAAHCNVKSVYHVCAGCYNFYTDIPHVKEWCYMSLIKTAYDFETDPQWKQLYDQYQESEQGVADARGQLDQNLLHKSRNAINHSTVGGMVLGGLGGAAGFGALNNAESTMLGHGPVRRSVKMAGGGLGGLVGGGLLGAMVGNAVGRPISNHYDQKQDRVAWKHYQEQNHKMDDADEALINHEMDRG